MITDPWFYAAAIPAVVLTGISKGGFAGGFGTLSVPLMALTIGPAQAAGILLPILIAMDMVGLYAYRGIYDWPNVRALVPGAALGIGFGALTFGLISDNVIRLVLGIIAIAFAVYSLWPRTAALQAPIKGWLSGPVWGGVAGFTSFVAHAGGPPFQIHMLPQRLDKTLFVGTSVIVFTLINLMKLPPYFMLGQLSGGNLATSAVLLPLAVVGVLLGVWLHKLVPERPFYFICYGLLLPVGAKLIYDGLFAG